MMTYKNFLFTFIGGKAGLHAVYSWNTGVDLYTR